MFVVVSAVVVHEETHGGDPARQASDEDEEEGGEEGDEEEGDEGEDEVDEIQSGDPDREGEGGKVGRLDATEGRATPWVWNCWRKTSRFSRDWFL